MWSDVEQRAAGQKSARDDRYSLANPPSAAKLHQSTAVNHTQDAPPLIKSHIITENKFGLFAVSL